jgi:hypothetical protein
MKGVRMCIFNTCYKFFRSKTRAILFRALILDFKTQRASCSALISLPRSCCSCRAAYFLLESYFALVSYRRKYRGVITRDISHFAILGAIRPDAPEEREKEREIEKESQERDRNLQKISAD